MQIKSLVSNAVKNSKLYNLGHWKLGRIPIYAG